MQPHWPATPPPPHVSLPAHTFAHDTMPLQPSGAVPVHVAPHACCDVSGVHEHTPPLHVSGGKHSAGVHADLAAAAIAGGARAAERAGLAHRERHAVLAEAAGASWLPLHWAVVHVTVPWQQTSDSWPMHWPPQICDAVPPWHPHWFATPAPAHESGKVQLPQFTRLPQLSISWPQLFAPHGFTGEHIGWQTPLAQLPDAQSAFVPQVLPFAHAGHGPPQSTSVSPWFFAPSLHVPAQLPHGPPQSVPVSLPSFT